MRTIVEEGATRVSLATATSQLGRSFKAARQTDKPDIVGVARRITQYFFIQTQIALGD